MDKILITKDMIKEGYSKGIIAVVDDAQKYGCDGICCMIGNNAFYFDFFGTSNYTKASDYIENTGINRVIDQIYEALDKCIRIEFEDEYEYYYLILKENGIC